MAHAPCMVDTYVDTNPEYAILIALPLQQWLHELSSVLCYMSIVCLSTRRGFSLKPNLHPIGPGIIFAVWHPMEFGKRL